MAFKFVVLATLLAAANAGFIGSPVVSYAAAPIHAPAIGASHESTVRSLDGNHAVSHYSKAVDSAFSSVRKTDTRVSNDAVAYAPAAYHAAPVAAYAAPAVATYAAPAYSAYAAPAYSAYAAPAYSAYAAPAVASYAAAPVAAYHAAAPVAAYHAAAPVVAKAGLVGVAYSAAPAVAHLSFDGYGVHYGY